MKRLAVILGVEKYDHYPPTSFCHSDAKALADVLMEQYDYSEQDMVLALLSPDEPLSPVEVIDKIKELVAKSLAGDTILFYFAGHGDIDKSGEPHLILPGTVPGNHVQTALPLRDVSSLLRQKDRVNVRIVDACHSGFDVRSSTSTNLDSAGFARAILAPESAEGWITLAACKWDELSHGDPKLNNGVFTHALCETLRDWEVGKPVYPELLKLEVCTRVERWSEENNRQQTPTLNAAVAGNVVIAVKRQPVLQEDEPIIEPYTEASLLEEVMDEREADLQTRLAKLRQFPMLGGEGHKVAVGKYVKLLNETMQRHVDEISAYGCQVISSGPVDAGGIDDSLKASVISEVEKRSVKPMHNVHQYRERPKNSVYAAAWAVEEAIRGPNIKRVVQQGGWPPCYFDYYLLSDGYVPNGLLFCYSIPLQTRLMVLVGTCVGIANSGNRPDWKSVNIGVRFVDDIGNVVQPDMEELLCESIQRLNGKVATELAERLKYLDYEASQE